MADLTDVMHGIRDAAAAVLADLDLIQPSQTWGGTRLYVGWPDASLDADLKAGITHVSISERPGMARSIGPYLTGWVEHPGPAPSMTASVAEDTATFAGTGLVPGMIAAVIVDGAAAYTYPLVAGDGPAQVAAALAAKVSADRSATATDAALAVPGAFSLVARVVGSGTEQRELRRIVQSIVISIWASRPTTRDRLAQALDEALEVEMRTLLMPDGSKATLNYTGTAYEEEARQQPMHRRDLFVDAEYSMSRTRAVPGIATTLSPIEVDPAQIRRVVIS